MLTRFWKRARTAKGGQRASSTRMEPRWDALEERQLLSGAGTDYVLSGFTWSDPSKITYSYPTDNVSWDQGLNSLNASLNADYGSAIWKREIAKALQTWASVANINVLPVSDSNAAFNSLGQSQGDPKFGDIRIGGYDFASQTILAQTYYPPPNGVTAAGDVEVNTGFTWGPHASFDLYSVMLHETGHALGMAHSPQPTAVMNATYGGVRTGLTSYDIEGIQAMYGARTADSYQGTGQGISPATAIDLTSDFNNLNTATLFGVSLATIGDTEYFSVLAPSGMTNTSLQAAAVASGISSLSPKITVYDASMNPQGSASDPNAWSDNATVNVGNIQPGGRYVIAVTGATNDVFAVGSYALQVKFAGSTSTPPPVVVTPPIVTPPVVAPPTTFTVDYTPPGVPPRGQFTTVSPLSTSPTNIAPAQTPIVSPTLNLGYVSQTIKTGQSLPTASNVNLYSFVPASSGTIATATGTTTIQVANQYGQVVASGTGEVSFKAPKAGIRYFVAVTSTNGQPVPDYNLAILVTPPVAINRARTNRSHTAMQVAGPAVVAPHATDLAPFAKVGGLAVQRSAHRPVVATWPHRRVAVVASHWSGRS
jgi:predicted Zn-dependent protease